CDASHLTDPDQTGAGPGLAMSAALADAGIGPEDIGYVSAHATSTPSGDIAEARAIAGAGLAHAAVSATKSLHGHTLGGAGGVEAAASLLPLARGGRGRRRGAALSAPARGWHRPPDAQPGRARRRLRPRPRDGQGPPRRRR